MRNYSGGGEIVLLLELAIKFQYMSKVVRVISAMLLLWQDKFET